MTYKQEQMLKQLVRERDCSSCLENMKKNNSKMIDCAFRYNNDEHLCDKAKKYIFEASFL